MSPGDGPILSPILFCLSEKELYLFIIKFMIRWSASVYSTCELEVVCNTQHLP